jgi:hypothetical protein
MTNNKQQTAVEWLRQELLKRDMDVSVRELFEQAKEMEKEQEKKTWNDALNSVEKKLELLQRNIRR